MRVIINEMDYYVKDINLADKGKKAVELTLWDMPGIVELERMYVGEKPLRGVKITGCVIVTYETAAFIILLKKLGADLRWSSDNKYESQTMRVHMLPLRVYKFLLQANLLTKNFSGV